MRILFLSNYYPPFELGGYEQLCRDVALMLQEKDHEVAVLTSAFGSDNNVQDEKRVYRLLRISPRYDSGLSVAAQFFLRRSRDELYVRKCLHEVCSSFLPDIIFIWNLQGLPRILALEAESMPGVAVAYWLAGYSPAEPDEYWLYWSSRGKSRLSRLMKSVLSRKALAHLRAEGKPVRPEMRHTAVVSDFMRQKGLRDGTLPRNSEVIYNGVEIEQFYQPVTENEGPLKLLQAGRISPNKGVHITIEALSKLVNESGVRKVFLTIAGSGRQEDLSLVDELIKQNELSDYVSLLGWVPREHMAQIMHEHHVLLLPTVHQEAFARVVLEAMAAGLTVVAAETGGSSEIVQHDETGLICQANDPAGLAEQISRLIENHQLRLDLARQGQQVVIENFSLENMVDRLETFLGQALEEKQLENKT